MEKKRMIKIIAILVLLFGLVLICNCNINASEIKKENKTPVQIHGGLKLNGTNIVDKNGDKFQLRGISTHGIAWFPQYVNQDAFNYMRDKWKINAIRLAMYSDPSAGYSKSMNEKVKQGVEYAKNAGLYVIIDWHILSDGNPNTYKSSAIEFFREMANLYKNDENIIYEICNEPNGDVQWERDIKPYAEEVIREIRNIDKNAIIVVGTPTWSQDVDIVSQSPITGYENIMYSLHFYAATHKDYLRQKAQTALNSGLPIFVTEFGICDASGNGAIDEQEANTWIKFLDDNNISWMCWNLSNKDESSAILDKNTGKISDWSNEELSQCGKWLIGKLNNYPEEKVQNQKDDNQKSIEQNTIINEVVENNQINNNEVKNENTNIYIYIIILIIVFILGMILGSVFTLLIKKSKNK